MLLRNHSTTTTHYETLGVAQNATTQEIKTAYRQLCLQTHPDVAGPSSTDRFKQIAHAHDVLSNPKQRQLYDRQLIRYQSNAAAAWGYDERSHSSRRGHQQRYHRTSSSGAAAADEDLRSYFYQKARNDFARRARESSSSSSSSSTTSSTTSSSAFFGRGGWFVFSAPNVVRVGLGLVAVWWMAHLLTASSSTSSTSQLHRSSGGSYNSNNNTKYDNSNSYRGRHGSSNKDHDAARIEFVEAWKNPTTGYWEQPAPWDPTYRRIQPKLEMVPRHLVRQRSL